MFSRLNCLLWKKVIRRTKVTIVEVGPRDGLQNEKQIITLPQKIKLVELLLSAGLKNIEIGSFVSPKWVPQMSATAELLEKVKPNFEKNNASISALVPNEVGMEQALKCGLQKVAVFTTVSETFSRKNTNCSIDESLKRIGRVIEMAQPSIRIRAYVSCIFDCPYEGKMKEAAVVKLTKELLSLGCYQVSLGDTIGRGTPDRVRSLMKSCAAEGIQIEKELAGHFHDTFGMGIANVLAWVEEGGGWVDASINGLGGCPYAPGAAGNVATEEVLYLLQGLGVAVDGLDLQKLLKAAEYTNQIIPHRQGSKLFRAMKI